MWLKVNGKIRQNSSTSNMIFDVDTIVSYVSQFMSLLPGDLITTELRPGSPWVVIRQLSFRRATS